MYKLFFQLIILFSFGGLSAETVILKSGKEVDGKVIHRDETKILIVEKGNGNTVTYYSKEEVKSIKVGDPTPTPTKTENSLPLRTKFFGTLKTDITYSDNAVLSYDIESHQSANSAKRQVMARDNSARWGIMFNQTMLGYEVEYGEKIKGKILVDFVDLTQSNAIISLRPRLLVGKIEYKPNKYFSVFGGQDFDIFSNLIPHSYNFSGLMNTSGNVGFMRQQVGATGYFSVFSLTVAAGRPQVNYGKPNPSLGNELNSTPLISSNLKMILGDYKFYLSGTYVDLKVRQPLIDTNRDNLYLYYDVGTSDLSNTFLQSYRIGGDGPTKVKSGGYSFGMEIPFKSLEFKGEMYMGQNLGNLAMSSPSNIQSTTVKEAISNSELGAYTTTDPWLNTYKNNSQPIYKPIKEVGAWGSVNYKINESYQVGIHGGAMKVLNPEDIVPASSSTYLLSQVDTTSAYWNVNSKVGGVRENSTMGYRLAYLPEPNLTFFFQHDYLQTFYKNTDREKGYFSYIDSIQWETGVITLKPINYSYLKSGGKASSHMVRLGVALSF